VTSILFILPEVQRLHNGCRAYHEYSTFMLIVINLPQIASCIL